MYYGKDRLRARHRGANDGGLVEAGLALVSSVLPGNLIDLDMRVPESYNGVTPELYNLEGDSAYDFEFVGVTAGDGFVNLGTDNYLGCIDNNGPAVPFFNELHKDTVTDYYMGFKFETGTSLGSNIFMDAASGTGLELIMASDGRTKSKRRTSLGNEEITTSSVPAIAINTSYELFYTRRASDGAFRVFINGTQVDSSVLYTISELGDANLNEVRLFREFTSSGWKGIAVSGANVFLDAADVANISSIWAGRD